MEEILWYRQDWLLSCAVLQRNEDVGQGMKLPTLAKHLTAVNQVIIIDEVDVMSLLLAETDRVAFEKALSMEAIALIGRHDRVEMSRVLVEGCAKFRASLATVLYASRNDPTIGRPQLSRSDEYRSSICIPSAIGSPRTAL